MTTMKLLIVNETRYNMALVAEYGIGEYGLYIAYSDRKPIYLIAKDDLNDTRINEIDKLFIGDGGDGTVAIIGGPQAYCPA
jgi:hypothetical protein